MTGKVLTRFVTTSLVVVVVVVVLQNIFGQSFITSPNTYATVYHLPLTDTVMKFQLQLCEAVLKLKILKHRQNILKELVMIHP